MRGSSLTDFSGSLLGKLFDVSTPRSTSGGVGSSAGLGVPTHENADFLEGDDGREAVLVALLLGQPRIDLPLQLLEVEGAHEKDAQAEDHVDHRGDVDLHGVVGRLADVLGTAHESPPLVVYQRTARSKVQS